jgi:hypothetical protein
MDRIHALERTTSRLTWALWGWYGTSPSLTRESGSICRRRSERISLINSDANPLHLDTSFLSRIRQVDIYLNFSIFARRQCESGLATWHKSEAKKLLKIDIDDDMHLQMKPALLRSTRKEYRSSRLRSSEAHLSRVDSPVETDAYRFEKRIRRGKPYHALKGEAIASILIIMDGQQQQQQQQ